MILIRATKGEKNHYVIMKKQVSYREGDAVKLLGAPIQCFKYLTDDWVIVRADCNKYDDFGINELASFYSGMPIYGDCILIEPGEVSSEHWLYKSRHPRCRTLCNRVREGERAGSPRREDGAGGDVQGSSPEGTVGGNGAGS